LKFNFVSDITSRMTCSISAVPDFDGQRIGHFSSGVGAQARNVASCPEIAGRLGRYDGSPAQRGIGAVTEGFDIRVVADLNANKLRRLRHCAGEARPLIEVEVRLSMNEELRRRRPMAFLVSSDDHPISFAA
jgi:hypothetical protein